MQTSLQAEGVAARGVNPRPAWRTRAAQSCAHRLQARQHVARSQVSTAEQVEANGTSAALVTQQPSKTLSLLEFDSVLQKELEKDGSDFRRARKTKMVCTIGPASCSPEVLEELASGGMNIARLNMCHGTHDWHAEVIKRIRKLNEQKGYCVAIMVDTEGSEIHTGELIDPIRAEEGDVVYFSVRHPLPPEIRGCPTIKVSYDSFIDDVEAGDAIVVDGGMVTFHAVEKAGPDVKAVCEDPGLILSRANLTFRRNGSIIRGRNTLLPVISAKDWRDIDFAISMEVDFLAVSFVKSADVIKNLRSYIQTRAVSPDQHIELIAKIESYDSIPNVDDIINASDGVMVARGDLGAQLAVEDVPSVQKYVVVRARQLGKTSIVAHQLLQSMIEYPIPTRAEVADVADVVRQRADAVMLSGESAMGKYPHKALEVLRAVSTRVEQWVSQEKYGAVVLPEIAETADGRVSEEICASAATIANNLKAAAIFVYTRRGFMANFISRCRPDCPVFAFTDAQAVRRRLNLRWGVLPFRVEFSDDLEDNVFRTFQMLKERGFLKEGDRVVVVTDLRPREQDIVRSVQVRRVI